MRMCIAGKMPHCFVFGSGQTKLRLNKKIMYLLCRVLFYSGLLHLCRTHNEVWKARHCKNYFFAGLRANAWLARSKWIYKSVCLLKLNDNRNIIAVYVELISF